MKRGTEKQLNRVSVILTADFHLTDKAPLCRTDANWWDTMAMKLTFISELADKYQVEVYHAGDLFDTWKPSPELLTFAAKYLPKRFFTILGNHDLPQHNIDLYSKCGVSVLAQTNRIQVLNNDGIFHWGMNPMGAESEEVIAHYMVRSTAEKPWPGCTDPPASKLLHSIKAKLILTGHNHKAFVEEYQGRILVNPGSIFRLTADQKDYNPRVYLYDDESNQVKPVFLPIEDNVSDHHLEDSQAKNDRIKQFIENLKGTWEPSFSLEENLNKCFKANKTPEMVQKIIWKAMEQEM